MKKLMAAFAVVLLVGCSSSDGNGSDNDAPPDAGTWVNETLSVKKIVVEDDGSFRGYSDLDETLLYREGTCTVDEQWTDEAGDIWFENSCTDTNDLAWCELSRVSADGSVLEIAFGFLGCPESHEGTNVERYERADS